MRNYLTNLAARSLEPTPAIQPRLASLFEPLSLVGPLFPRPGQAGERFEIVADRDQTARNDLTQSRADNDRGTEPSGLSLPTTSMKSAKESSDPTTSEATQPVSNQRPVAATINLAEAEPRIPKERDDKGSRDQIVSASRPAEEGKAKIVVPVIDVAASSETPPRDELGRPEKVSDAIRNEVAVTLLADTNQTSRPGESTGPENESVARRDSESLKDSRAENRSTATAPLSQNDQERSSSQSLVVPRAKIEAIRAERDPRPSTPAESAAPRDAIARSPILYIRPQGESRVRPIDTEGDEPNARETPPSINVTIGRVEVRAQLPPASRPAGKNSESPKLMGLDDYLRQRAQGGKR